jgi:hypothetical protein
MQLITLCSVEYEFGNPIKSFRKRRRVIALDEIQVVQE